MLLKKLLVEGKSYVASRTCGIMHCFVIVMALFCHCFGIVFRVVNFGGCMILPVFEGACASWHILSVKFKVQSLKKIKCPR